MRNKITPAETLADEVPAAVFAELIGIGPENLADLARRGIVHRSRRGWYPLSEVARYCEHLRRRSDGAPADDKARLVRARAELVEAKAAAARGELVPAAEVERRWVSSLQAVRAAVLAIPRRVQARLPALPQHEIDVIAGEARRALDEAAGSCGGGDADA